MVKNILINLIERYENMEAESKNCEFCGSEFFKKPTDQQGNWNRKRFCDRTCAAKANPNKRNDSIAPRRITW